MATSIFINGNEHALSSGLSLSLSTGSIPLKPITQAEYNALSEEEKNSETAWLVSDAEGGGGSSVVGGGSSDEVYSEEETRIGTWIDGKPLYRRVFITPKLDVAGSWVTLASMADANVDTVTLLRGMMNRTSFNDQAPIPYINANNFMIVRYMNETKTLIGYANSESGGFHSDPIILVVEYTKTTDT